MRVSREMLVAASEETGFRPEMLEKVVHLLGLLEGFRSHPYLKTRLALKGGTALNLFVFDLPRLSVDIDLNYVGAVELDRMREERPKVEQAMQAVFAREDFEVRRIPEDHAGGKWRLHYASALGGNGELQVDLNYMYRVPLWPVVIRDSRPVGPFRAEGIPLLDVHELAAGKLVALHARKASRDLFDAHLLLTQGDLRLEQLRVAFVVYGAMSRKDWRSVSLADIDFDSAELRAQLEPVLRGEGRETRGGVGPSLVEQCRQAMRALLPLTSRERRFLDRLLEDGEITPDLITGDAQLNERILLHPSLRWKALNVRKRNLADPRA